MNPDHKENLVSLKRIEGQVRGVQRMIEEKKYCIDILIQLRAVNAALARVEDKILAKHFQMCVKHAASGSSQAEKDKKIDEVMLLIKKFRKI